MKRLFKNQKGFSHHVLLPVLVIVAVAAIGSYVLTQSHAITPATIQTVIPRNGKIIAYNFSINPDGSGYKTIPIPPNAITQYSAVSANGTQIIFQKSSIGSDYNIVDEETTAGTGIHYIATLPAKSNFRAPVWSPNGTWIASSYDGYISVNSPQGIWLVKSNGTDGHKLSGISNSYLVGWLPNSSALIYFTFNYSPNPNIQMCTINIDGSNKKCNALLIGSVKLNSIEDPAPIVSPNGKEVLFLGSDRNYSSPPTQYSVPTNIFSVNLNGTGLKQLTSFSADQQHFGTIDEISWSPDSSKIAYLLFNPSALLTSGVTGKVNGLYIMNANGTSNIQIKNLSIGGGTYPMTWTTHP
jgi:Tol biopolymer transport system component